MSEIKTVAQIRADIKKFSPYPDRVKLLAVSKKQPIEKIKKLIEQDQLLFGENYVQEAFEKMDFLPGIVEWHLIGHLQSKKVNSIIGKFSYIHSVDSAKLLQLIADKSKASRKTQNIFIEINLENEETKTGFNIANLEQQWSSITAYDGVKICGLMALPPLTDDEKLTRDGFKKLRSLQEKLRTQTDTTKHPMTELSMGTSQDYVIALQEGSTYIRIGTTLFGERQ